MAAAVDAGTKSATAEREDLPAQDFASAALSLASRFASGATMWCVAPRWPWHAHHLAVEFVHPVIMGKRALPAVAVEGHDVIATVRAQARSGDILIAVADADDTQVSSAMLRARAWGLLSVWIGAGRRPEPGAADHVLWLGENDTDRVWMAAYGGQFVLAYHLIWELTHVCFEHPGLVKANLASCEGDVCITCSDEGRLGEVQAIADQTTAKVRTAVGVEEVDMTLVGKANPGDLVLIHAGSAVTLIEAIEGQSL